VLSTNIAETSIDDVVFDRHWESKRK